MIQIKNSSELSSMQKAGKIAAGALQAAGQAIRPGITTAEIDIAVRDYIRAKGAKASFLGYNGFKGNSCISLNDTVIHGIPSKTIIVQQGDIVSVDVGAYFEGFHGDTAYTFCCGEVSPETQKLLTVTQEALAKGIQAAVVGNRVGDISHAVQSHVEANGYSVVRDFVGHGVGRELHESPEVPNFGKAGYGPRLLAGMTLAIEPMVNQGGWQVYIENDGWTVKTVDKSLCAHYEHTIAITKDGPMILTLP